MRWFAIVSASVLVSLNALAVGPTANDQTTNTVVLSLRQSIGLSYNDPDGGDMSFTLLNAPAQGTLEWRDAGNYLALTAGVPVAAGTWYYSTTATNEGGDSFTWQVSDGTSTSRMATVTINLTGNSVPLVSSTTNSQIIVGAIRCPFFPVFSHADALQPITYTFPTLPANGLIEYSQPGETGPIFGAVQTNTPITGNTGSVSFYYTAPTTIGTNRYYSYEYYSINVGDGIATSLTITNWIPIQGIYFNNPISVGNYPYYVTIGCVRSLISLSYSHLVSGSEKYQRVQFELLTPPSQGTLECQSGTNWVTITTNMLVNTNGWRYTPTCSNPTNDSFTWRATDGVSTSGSARPSITLSAYVPPVAIAKTNSMVVNSMRMPLSGQLWCSGGYPPKYEILTSLPTNGVLEYYDGTNYVTMPQDVPIARNATSTGFQWYYTPARLYVGGDSFRWMGSDGVSTSSAITYTLNVTSNKAPAAYSSYITGSSASNLNVYCSYMDWDAVEGAQPCAITLVGNPSHGTLTLTTNYVNWQGCYFGYIYTPNPGFTKGVDAFSFKVNDTIEDSNIATVTIHISDPSDHVSNLVLIVVNDIVRPVISNEIARLKADLEAEGYTAKIKDWHLAGSNSSNLWAYLRGEYENTNQYLEGAILVGDIPKAAHYPTDGAVYTDLVYWNLKTFGTNSKNNQIWVSRMNADDTAWGPQDVLLRRALDANHGYRRGLSRLPFNAYMFDCLETSTLRTNAFLDVWPAVFGGGGGDHNATYKFAPWRTDINNAACDCFVLGGELFQETSHGYEQGYMEGGNFDKPALYRLIAQQRVALVESCSSGVFGGIANNHIFTRGGGLVLAVAASEVCREGDISIVYPAGNGVGFISKCKPSYRVSVAQFRAASYANG